MMMFAFCCFHGVSVFDLNYIPTIVQYAISRMYVLSINLRTKNFKKNSELLRFSIFYMNFIYLIVSVCLISESNKDYITTVVADADIMNSSDPSTQS